MRKLSQLVVFLTMIFSTFLLFSCDDTAQNTSFSGKSLETALSEMAALGESEKKIITFDIVFDKHANSYTCEHVKIIKESKKIIDFVKGASPHHKYMGNSYEVECTDTEGNVSVTHCSDYACVGYFVALCVESGGCAQVCKAKAKYYPSVITE